MILVIDASVAVKWLVEESDSQRALRILDQDPDVCAPDLMISEIVNALWKKLKQGEVNADQARLSIQQLPELVDRWFRQEELSMRAFDLSVELDHPAYDCFYLAAAERSNAVLVTADERLQSKVRGTRYQSSVVSLKTWQSVYGPGLETPK